MGPNVQGKRRPFIRFRRAGVQRGRQHSGRWLTGGDRSRGERSQDNATSFSGRGRQSEPGARSAKGSGDKGKMMMRQIEAPSAKSLSVLLLSLVLVCGEFGSAQSLEKVRIGMPS